MSKVRKRTVRAAIQPDPAIAYEDLRLIVQTFDAAFIGDWRNYSWKRLFQKAATLSISPLPGLEQLGKLILRYLGILKPGAWIESVEPVKPGEGQICRSCASYRPDSKCEVRLLHKRYVKLYRYTGHGRRVIPDEMAYPVDFFEKCASFTGLD